MPAKNAGKLSIPYCSNRLSFSLAIVFFCMTFIVMAIASPAMANPAMAKDKEPDIVSAHCPDLHEDGERLCTNDQLMMSWVDFMQTLDEWEKIEPRQGFVAALRSREQQEFRKAYGCTAKPNKHDYPQECADFVTGELDYQNEMAHQGLEIAKSYRPLSIKPGASFLSAIESECAFALNGCEITGFGVLSDIYDDGADSPKILWQKLRGRDPLTDVPQNIIIGWEYENSRTTAKLIGYALADGGAKPPAYWPSENGGVMVHFPAFFSGTGQGNADTLFARNADGTWRNIDMERWKLDMAQHLPKGLEVWKGISYQAGYGNSPLWRETDANCCATGGEVDFLYDIKNDALAIKETSVRHSPALSWEMPICPVEKAEYTIRGEEGKSSFSPL